MFGMYMDEYTQDLVKSLNTLREVKDKVGSGVLKDYAQLIGQPSMFSKVAALQIPESKVLNADNVARVLRFWDSLASRSLSSSAKVDLMMLGEDYMNGDGEPDPKLLEPLFKLRESLGTLRKAIEDASKALTAAEDSDGANRLGWLAGTVDKHKLEFVKWLVNTDGPKMPGTDGEGIDPKDTCYDRCGKHYGMCKKGCKTAECADACDLAYHRCRLACFDELVSASKKKHGELPACSSMFHDDGGSCRRPFDGTEMMYCNLVRSGALEAMRAKKDAVLSFMDTYAKKPTGMPGGGGGLAGSLLGDASKEPDVPRSATAAYVYDAIMTVHDVHLALNTYFEGIRAGYETRKVGFRWNYTVLQYYFAPYVRYIFEVKVKKEIWQRFGFNFKKAMTDFNDMWAKIPKFLGTLLLKLVGEGFRQRQSRRQEERRQQKQQQQAAAAAKAAGATEGDSASGASGAAAAPEWFQDLLDTLRGYMEDIVQEFTEEFVVPLDDEVLVEGFGFLKGLLSIGQFFVALLGVAKAVAKLITNPFAIIMMIIGLVIAAVFMVVYILMTVLFMQMWFFGPIYAISTVLCPAIFWTILFTLLVIPLTIVYTLLWILDMATGGLIMTLLRCESLPDSWYKNSSYAYGNRIFRGILCNLRCASRYKPVANMVAGNCVRMTSKEPSFCPQQTVYQLHKGRKPEKVHVFQDYVATAKTALMSDDERRDYLADTYKLKNEFLLACDNCIKDDYVGVGKKEHYRYYPVVKAMCRHGVHASAVSNSPENQQVLADVCTSIYCDYLSPAIKATGSPGLCLSASPPLSGAFAKVAGGNEAPNDIVMRSLGAFIVMLVLLALITYTMHASGNTEGGYVKEILKKVDALTKTATDAAKGTSS